MIPEKFRLTQNQSEVFYLLAHGYTIQMIAYIMGVNPGSVADTVRRVKKKLSALSIRHALSMLMTFGYIKLDSVASPVVLKLMQRQDLFPIPDYELDQYSIQIPASSSFDAVWSDFESWYELQPSQSQE